MRIFTNAEKFKPENFVIIDFYGVETCFAWQNDNLVTFPYGQSASTIPKLQVIVAPHEIATIRSYDSRAFVVCKPTGVYKLNKLFKFCLLSQTGIGLGQSYYEVLCVENRWLCAKNKITKTNRELFRLEPTSTGLHDICGIILGSSTSDPRLRSKVCLLVDDEDICVIGNDKKIFAVTAKDVQLIHRCDQEIRDIVPILGNATVAGFVIVSEDSAVLVYANDEELVFDKVHLDSKVRDLCAGFGQTSNVILIAHIDDSCIYYSLKSIGDGTFQRTKVDRGELLKIHNYKNRVFIGLSNDKQILEMEMQKVSLEISDSEKFFNLRPDMLKGSEKIMDEVCETAKELQLLNELVLEEQEKLTRINIYAQKQAIVYSPKVRIERIAGQIFLRVEIGNVLPNNCHIVVSLKSGLRTIHCMKLVDDRRILIDVPVDVTIFDDSLELCIDLVTLASESEPWCLIRDYIKSPKVNNKPINSDRAKFLTAKLAALENLMADGTLDIKKLSNIKKSIRREV